VTFSSQTLNGAQQYAQGIEFSITHEPTVGLGYRVNAAFERNYYLDMPASFFPAGSRRSPPLPACRQLRQCRPRRRCSQRQPIR